MLISITQSNSAQNGPLSTSAVTQSNIDIICTDEKKSQSSKKYHCCYCLKPQAKIPRHLLTVHKDEDDVKKYNQLTDKSAKQALMTKLRNLGNHLCVVYRSELTVPPTCYTLCQYCFGYYVSWDLWKHMKNVVALLLTRSSMQG